MTDRPNPLVLGENTELVELKNKQLRFWSVDPKYTKNGYGNRVDIPVTKEEADRFMSKSCRVRGEHRDVLEVRIPLGEHFLKPVDLADVVVLLQPWSYHDHAGTITYLKEVRAAE